MKQFYVSIGNSDDKLGQAQWAEFIADMEAAVEEHTSHTHGRWFSEPNSQWQSACWCVEFDEEDLRPYYHFRDQLRTFAEYYDQDSIAFATATTELLAASPDAAAEEGAR